MKKIQLIAYFMALLSFWGCSSCPDQYGDDDGEEKQNLSLRYERNPNEWQPVIGAFGYIPTDSVKLYDENYILIDNFVCKQGGTCSFVYIDENTPNETDITKTYYLYLSYQDTDTIRHEFRVNDNSCKFLLDYGRFFYNNQLITENGNKDFIPAATIIKN
jgi:rubredoxin